MIGDKICYMFEVGEFDICELILLEFVLVIFQKLCVKVLILVKDVIDEGVECLDLVGVVYDVELDEESIFNVLLLCYVDIVIFLFLFENVVGEMGLKMVVMDNVMCNVGELIDKLNIIYNCICQVQIIMELIEIIFGVEVFQLRGI